MTLVITVLEVPKDADNNPVSPTIAFGTSNNSFTPYSLNLNEPQVFTIADFWYTLIVSPGTTGNTRAKVEVIYHYLNSYLSSNSIVCCSTNENPTVTESIVNITKSYTAGETKEIWTWNQVNYNNSIALMVNSNDSLTKVDGEGQTVPTSLKFVITVKDGTSHVLTTDRSSDFITAHFVDVTNIVLTSDATAGTSTADIEIRIYQY